LDKSHLGQKFTCDSCGARFYDLNKSPVTCPKCGAVKEQPKIIKNKKVEPTDVKEKNNIPDKKSEKMDSIAEIEDVDIIDSDVDSEEGDTILGDTNDISDDDDLDGVIPNIKNDKEES
jgi:uncharacterized protein (TIGR02300 family)